MDFSAEAQSLVDTFSAISSPTTEDINTLTLSISQLLNTEGITQDESADVINILTTVIATNSTLSSDFTLSVETAPMSDETYAKFLTAASGLESQEGAEYDALLTLYTNLNYSNYMTLMIDADTVTTFYDNLMIYLENCLEDDQVLSLKTPILDALTSNAVDSSSGMAKNEFILACKDILALLFSYFTLDEISYFKTSFERFITMNFLNISTYATTMALSGASTLTSTVSTYFGITSIPLTPENSETLIEEASNFFLIYPFTDEQISEIIVAMTSYFTSLEYTMGLSAAQVGGAWSAFEAVATPMITDTSLYTACQWLSYLKTSFASITTAAYTKGVTNLLPSLAYFDSWAIEDLYYTNPLVATDGIMPIAGNFLSDWLDTFSENLSAKVGQTLSDVLKIAITDLIKTENNAVYRDGLLRGYAVSAQNFIQIGIEILLFLSNFMEQSDRDEMALKLTDFLISILYVSTFIDDSWEEINILVQVIVAVVILAVTIFLSVFSGGVFMVAVGAFFSTLASGSTGAVASAAAAGVVTAMLNTGLSAAEGLAAGAFAAAAYTAIDLIEIGVAATEGAVATTEAAITATEAATQAAEAFSSLVNGLKAAADLSATFSAIGSAESIAGTATALTTFIEGIGNLGISSSTVTTALSSIASIEGLTGAQIGAAYSLSLAAYTAATESAATAATTAADTFINLISTLETAATEAAGVGVSITTASMTGTSIDTGLITFIEGIENLGISTSTVTTALSSITSIQGITGAEIGAAYTLTLAAYTTASEAATADLAAAEVAVAEAAQAATEAADAAEAAAQAATEAAEAAEAADAAEAVNTAAQNAYNELTYMQDLSSFSFDDGYADVATSQAANAAITAQAAAEAARATATAAEVAAEVAANEAATTLAASTFATTEAATTLADTTLAAEAATESATTAAQAFISLINTLETASGSAEGFGNSIVSAFTTFLEGVKDLSIPTSTVTTALSSISSLEGFTEAQIGTFWTGVNFISQLTDLSSAAAAGIDAQIIAINTTIEGIASGETAENIATAVTTALTEAGVNATDITAATDLVEGLSELASGANSLKASYTIANTLYEIISPFLEESEVSNAIYAQICYTLGLDANNAELAQAAGYASIIVDANTLNSAAVNAANIAVDTYYTLEYGEEGFIYLEEMNALPIDENLSNLTNYLSTLPAGSSGSTAEEINSLADIIFNNVLAYDMTDPTFTPLTLTTATTTATTSGVTATEIGAGTLITAAATTESVASAGVYTLCSIASTSLTSTATGAITSSTINFLANANLSDTSTSSCEVQEDEAS